MFDVRPRVLLLKPFDQVFEYIPALQERKYVDEALAAAAVVDRSELRRRQIVERCDESLAPNGRALEQRVHVAEPARRHSTDLHVDRTASALDLVHDLRG